MASSLKGTANNFGKLERRAFLRPPLRIRPYKFRYEYLIGGGERAREREREGLEPAAGSSAMLLGVCVCRQQWSVHL